MGDPKTPVKKQTKPQTKQQPTVTRTMTDSNGKVISSKNVMLAPSSVKEALGSKKNGGSVTKKSMGGKIVAPKKRMGGKTSC